MKFQARSIVTCLLIGWLAAETASGQQQAGVVMVPRGTLLKYSLVTSLDSATAKVGDEVSLRLARPLVVDGITLLQPGAIAKGRVTRVKRPGPKCRRGHVDWNVDNVSFSDSSEARTEKFWENIHFEPPERYPESEIQHRSGWQWVVYAPLIALELPLIAIATSGEKKCKDPGNEYVLPANATIIVIVLKSHHVHY